MRLAQGDQSAILMDDPAPGALDTFAGIANWLRQNGLSAPEIYEIDTIKGFMILQDLGPLHLADWITRHPQDTQQLYTAATDVLVSLNNLPPPPGLTTMTPAVGGAMLDVTGDWYAGRPTGELSHHMTQALATHCAAPTNVALRDYHAENLIWRPLETGLNRIGLLDFQDAIVAPQGYDLVSLLRDVRRAVDPDLAEQMTTHFASGLGTTPQALSAGLATLAVQRNLRILGVFARLARRDGKTRYMTMIPHLWNMLTQDLSHPALTTLKQVVDGTLPPPAHSAIKDLL